MIDVRRTLKLISGGLFDPETTWTNYFPEAGDWQKTAMLLTVPLILISAIAAYVFGFFGSDVSIFGRFRPTVMSTLWSVIFAGIAAVVLAFVISLLAGAFGGKNKFALGLAATSFAFIPGYLSSAVSWVPWVGGLLAFGMFVYAMVLLWKIIPIYLAVPTGKRAGHYILTLVVSIVALMILSMTVGRFLFPPMYGPSFGDRSSIGGSDSMVSGMFGGITRQAELMAAAQQDEYDPPSNGRLSKKQVREFIRVMQRASEIEHEKMEHLKELSEKADQDGEFSFRDLGSMMSGVTEAAGLHTSEIEVVMSAGGNWAEHQWVREALRTAWIQKDINDSVAHNYELYLEYADELSDYGLDYR